MESAQENLNNSKKVLFIVICIILILLVLLGGLYVFLSRNKNKIGNNQTDQSALNPSANEVITPTQANIKQDSKIQKTFSIESGFGDVAKKYSVLLNEEYLVEKYKQNKLFTMIFNSQEPSVFELLISISPDYFPQAYKQSINLNPTEYYSQLYRVQDMQGDWFYTTNNPYENSICHSSSGEELPQPCGLAYIAINKEENLDIFSAKCTSTTKSGLDACDEIVKTIRTLE